MGEIKLFSIQIGQSEKIRYFRVTFRWVALGA